VPVFSGNPFGDCSCSIKVPNDQFDPRAAFSSPSIRSHDRIRPGSPYVRGFPIPAMPQQNGRPGRGIDHLIFCIPGMNITPLEKQIQAPCIKALLLDFTHHPPVHGVSKFSHPFHLDEIRPAPISSSGVKTIRNSGWGRSENVSKCMKRRHDLGNSGFVIRPQQCLSIAENERFPDEPQEFRRLGGRQACFSGTGIDRMSLSVVILNASPALHGRLIPPGTCPDAHKMLWRVQRHTLSMPASDPYT
jgi:hypothetical protein